MKKIALLIIFFITEIVTFFRWSSCWLFKEDFYFTFQNLSTQLLTSTNEEKGLPLLLIRLLHNKITGFLWGILQTLLQYIDMRFLYEFLGTAGAVGVYLGFWYFFTKKPKNKIFWLGIMTLFICTLIEMILMPHIDFSKRIIPLFIVLSGFSLFGIWEFVTNGKSRIRFAGIVLLIILSLCALLLFPHSQYSMCLKV